MLTFSDEMWCVPCSLLCVLLSGQLASTSSATHVRLFLPCRRMVQSRRERSKALLVSSPTPLQGGILQDKQKDIYTLKSHCPSFSGFWLVVILCEHKYMQMCL